MRKSFKTNLDLPQVFLLLIAFFLLGGIMAGSILANTMEESHYTLLSDYLNHYVETIPSQLYEKSFTFVEIFVKYEKIVVFIWLLAFIPTGGVISLGILFTKGMGIGFTSAFLIKEFGVQGIIWIATLYFIQNLFLIPAYLWTTYNNLAYIAKYHGSPSKFAAKFNKNEMTEYFLVLITASSFVVLASLIEIFILPQFLM